MLRKSNSLYNTVPFSYSRLYFLNVLRSLAGIAVVYITTKRINRILQFQLCINRFRETFNRATA